MVWVFARVSRDPARTREIFAREKLGPAEYFDPETRLVHSLAMDLLRCHVDAGDADIGLRAGAGVVPGDFAVLEYAARSCPTLGDAIGCFARYVGLLNEAMEISLVEEGSRVLYRFRITDGVDQPPAANDFVMAAADAFAKHYCRFYEPPVEIRFAHPEPAYAAAYGKVFQTTVRFGAPENAFVMTRAQLATPLTSSHTGLRSEYESHAEALVANIRGSTGATVAVRRVLLGDLRAGRCTMAATARKLAMSVPTLRRRLEEEGVTYETVLDEVRYDLAKRYLTDPRITTSDVAFLVGFHHASSFSKAFRRWTGGVSLVEFRGRAAEARGDVRSG